MQDDIDEVGGRWPTVRFGDLVEFKPSPDTTIYSSHLNGMIGVVTVRNRHSTVAMVLLQDGIQRWMPLEYLRRL